MVRVYWSHSEFRLLSGQRKPRGTLNAFFSIDCALLLALCQERNLTAVFSMTCALFQENAGCTPKNALLRYQESTTYGRKSLGEQAHGPPELFVDNEVHKGLTGRFRGLT